MPRRLAAPLTVALVAFAAGLVLAAAARPRVPGLVAAADSGVPLSNPLLMALEVRGDRGEVLASPVVLGEEGKRVEVDLVQPGDPDGPRMSLALDPRPTADGGLCIGYQLAIGGVSRGHGNVTLPYGENRTLRFGRRGALRMFAARVPSPELKQFLARKKTPST